MYSFLPNSQSLCLTSERAQKKIYLLPTVFGIISHKREADVRSRCNSARPQIEGLHTTEPALSNRYELPLLAKGILLAHRDHQVIQHILKGKEACGSNSALGHLRPNS